MTQRVRSGAHAFVDESARSMLYLLAAVVVDPADLSPLRRDVRSLLLPGQRELHMKSENARRQRSLADRMVAAGVQTRLYVAETLPRRQADARASCLTAMIGDLALMGAHRLVLDTRTPVQDKRDEVVVRRALGAHPQRVGLTYEHLDSGLEPLLWVADIVAWCFGADGHWRKRISPAVVTVTDCTP